MDHPDKIIAAGYLCWQYQRWRDRQNPFTAYLCQHLRSEGFRPAILTRGYGGSLKGPIIADPAIYSAADIGDEALMLSQNEMVCISRDRIAGAAFIAANLPADVIIMDDGMQNPWLGKDITLAVFDGGVGLGNGRVFPPLARFAKRWHLPCRYLIWR